VSATGEKLTVLRHGAAEKNIQHSGRNKDFFFCGAFVLLSILLLFHPCLHPPAFVRQERAL
jgi:hypothetical protein